jgi:hypothetical protein
LCPKNNDVTGLLSGTRIVYERAFLMQMRHSPLAKSPPPNLPTIPGVTAPANGDQVPILPKVTNIGSRICANV